MMWYFYVTFIIYVVAIVGVFIWMAEGGAGYWEAVSFRKRIEAGEKLRDSYRYSWVTVPKDLPDAIKQEKKALKEGAAVIGLALIGPLLWLPALIAAAAYGLYYSGKSILKTLRLKPNE